MFYFLDRGGVGNQLSNNPGFNGVQEYTASSGYRVTFVGQGALNDNNSVNATRRFRCRCLDRVRLRRN